MGGILKREPLLDGRHADNLGYVDSVDEGHRLISEFETGLTTKLTKVSGTLVYIYTLLCFHVQIEHSIKEESCLAIVHSHKFI